MTVDKEAETSSSKIKLDYINTDTAAKNFAEMLNENKTFFLNGSWGSGKTEFLKKTKKYSSKSFNELKLWEVKDKRTVMSLCFRQLFPRIYNLSIFIIILGTITTAINSSLISLNFSDELDFRLVVGPFAIIVLYGIFKSLGLKLDHIHIVLLNLLSTKKIIPFCIRVISFFSFFGLSCNIFQIIITFKPKLSFTDYTIFIFVPTFLILIIILSIISDYKAINESVLIIDDFDRISKKRQEESYMVFNNLNGKMPIVFVGDYGNIVKNEDRYLQKIIDTHVELPYVLHPSNIWEDYLRKFSNEIKKVEPDYEVTVKFKLIAIQEKRNLREIEHFNEYVNREFFERGKVGHVQIDQQLWIIYVFLFHAYYYNKLRDDIDFELSESLKNYRNRGRTDGGYNKDFTIFDDKVSDYEKLSLNDMLVDTLDNIQNVDHDVYPQPFSRNPQNYLLYESPSNMPIDILRQVFDDEKNLKEYMLLNQNSDFYQYLSSEYSLSLLNHNKKLLDCSIDLIGRDKYSACINYIIREKNKDLTLVRGFSKGEVFTYWKTILEKHDFDLSMMFYFFNKFYILSFKDLAEVLQYIGISKKYKRNDYILHVYICTRGLWARYNEWDDKTFEAIKSLPDEQFLSFWVLQELFSNRSSNKYLVPGDKTYIIYNEKKADPSSPGSGYKLTLSYQVTINKIKPRLKELENKGYTFVYQTGTYRD